MNQKSRHLRKNQTEAENIIWQHLRNRQLAGCKFRRQHPVDNYIVDVICLDNKLVIELDGSQHMQSVSYDKKTERFPQRAGIYNTQILEQSGV